MPLPQRTRPLSILSSLKFRPSKQSSITTGPGTTAHHSSTSTSHAATGQSQAVAVTISGPLNLAVEGMVPSRPNGSTSTTINKMHAYAKAPEPVTNGSSAQRNVDRADTPHYLASRQAMADVARLNLPLPNKPTGANRFGTVNHQSGRSISGIPHPPTNSPPQVPHASPPMRRARTNSNDRVGGTTSLWPASVIADSEFNSPQMNGIDGSRHARHQPLNDGGGPQSQPAWNSRQSGQYGDFIIGSDGMMKVRTLSKDHSSEHNHVQDPYTGSPPHRAKLPVIGPQRRSYAERPPASNLADEDEMMGAIPSSFESNKRGLQVPQAEPVSHGVRPITQFDNIDDYEIRTDGAVTPAAIALKPEKKPPPKMGLMESSMPPFPVSKHERVKKRRHSCDYDDNQLSTMKYAVLENQAFDEDPAAEAPPPGASMSLDDEALAAKLDYYRTKPEAEQTAFFSCMTVDDWERSGDWFMDQIGSLVQKMKESRQNRRQVAAQFEREISKREESVRLKNDSITRKLDRMKHDGERVITNEEDD